MSFKLLQIPASTSGISVYAATIAFSLTLLGFSYNYSFEPGLNEESVENIENIQSAIDSYMFDTGSFLPVDGNNVNIGELFKNRKNFNSWGGPYYGISSEDENTITIKIGEDYTSFKGVRFKNANWASTPVNCQKNDCFIYLYASASKGSNKAKKLDNIYSVLKSKLDISNNSLEGKVRKIEDYNNTYLYYQVMQDYN